MTSLTVTTVNAVKDDPDNDDNDNPDEVLSRPTKRAKTTTTAPAVKKKKTKYLRHDPFHIWLHEEVDDDADMDDIPTTFGGKLAQLTVAGLMNAVSGVPGGIVEHYKKIIPRQHTTPAADANNNNNNSNNNNTVGATQLTFAQLHQVAMGLSRAIETRVQQDVLVTTPIRIQQMLAPDLQPHEFRSIRRRIYDTVILGKGMSQNHTQADEDELPVVASSSTNVHDIEKVCLLYCLESRSLFQESLISSSSSFCCYIDEKVQSMWQQ